MIIIVFAVDVVPCSVCSSRCEEDTSDGQYEDGDNCGPSEALLFLK